MAGKPAGRSRKPRNGPTRTGTIRGMVQATPTPNPNAMKFTIPGHRFASPQTVGSAAAAAGTPFAPLFALPGVASIFATADFVTIMKLPDAEWGPIVASATEALGAAF